MQTAGILQSQPIRGKIAACIGMGGFCPPYCTIMTDIRKGCNPNQELMYV